MKTIFRLYSDAYRGLPRDVWKLSAVLLVNRSGTMVLVFLTLYLTQELGYSLAVAGQVLSVYGLGHLAGAFLGGWLCDRHGALRIQFYSLALSGLGYLVFEHLQSVPGIMAVTFFVGTTAEAFRPANSAALAAFSPPHLRTRAVALNRMALNLGVAAGPAVGGMLATYDYAWLFRVDGATCLLAAFCLRVLFRNRRAESHEHPSSPRPAVELHPLRDAAFLGFSFLMFLFTLVFFQGWSTYPIYLNEAYGIAESRFGLLMTLNALLIFAFEMVLTHRAEAFRPLSVIGVGGFLAALGLAVLPLGTSLGLAMASVVIWTVGEMLIIPAAGGWVAHRAGPTHRGKYMGLYTMVWGLGFIAGPTAGSWLYQHAGADRLWLLVGLLGAGTWIGCEVLQRFMKRSPEVVDKRGVPAVSDLRPVLGADFHRDLEL